VAFFQFVDICARSGLECILPITQLFHLAATGCTRIGTKGLADLLSSAAATAALGSVLCSLLKLAVQHTKEQAVKAAAAGDAREDQGLSRVLYSPTLLFCKVLLPLVTALLPALEAAVAAAPSSSSSSSRGGSDSNVSNKQARASAMFLAVLVLRSVVQVHEAAANVPAAAAAGLAQGATAAPSVSNTGARGQLVEQLMASMLSVFWLVLEVLSKGVSMPRCESEQ
jgi:hypothetical protein